VKYAFLKQMSMKSCIFFLLKYIIKLLLLVFYIYLILEEFCYGVSGVPERYLEVPKIFFNHIC
jgi:hypothetical protein